MKQIRKPDEEEQSFLKRMKKKYETLDPAKKDQLITRIITGVIIIGIIIFIIVKMILPKQPTEEPLTPEPEQVTEMPGDFYVPENTTETPAAQSTQSPFNRTEESVTEEENDYYIIPDTGYSILQTSEGQNACLVYIPTGYEVCENGSVLQIKPEDYSPYVDGDNPITVAWDSVPYFDELIETGFVDVLANTGGSNFYTEYSYKIIDAYDYIAHQQASAKVYVIQITETFKLDDENTETRITYKIVVDLLSKTDARPTVTILQEDLRMLNDRYPDIYALAGTLFVPVNPDANTPDVVETDATETDASTTEE